MPDMCGTGATNSRDRVSSSTELIQIKAASARTRYMPIIGANFWTPMVVNR